jgi:hypothetical protein
MVGTASKPEAEHTVVPGDPPAQRADPERGARAVICEAAHRNNDDDDANDGLRLIEVVTPTRDLTRFGRAHDGKSSFSVKTRVEQSPK